MTLITNYESLTAPGNYDVLPIVDVSDHSMSEAGTTKKITYLDLTQGLSGGGGGGGGGSQLPWINVQDAPYSADGSGDTDATTAIQNAINVAGPGGVVYFPPGTYTISSALNVPSNITLMGDNGGNPYTTGYPSQINQTNTSAHGIYVPNAWNVYVKNLAILGPSYAWGVVGTGTGTGLYMGYTGVGPSGFNNVDGVFIGGFGGNGLYVATPIMSTYTRLWSAYNAGYGVYMNGGTTCTFESCWAPGNTVGGWYLASVTYCSWNGCGADANTGFGWNVNYAQGCSWSGCGAENNGGNCMNWVAAWGCTINGFWCSNSAIGLNVASDCYNCVVSGFVETPLGAAQYGCVIAAGASVTLLQPQMTDAMSLPAKYSYTVMTQNGTLYAGNASFGEPLPIASGGTGGDTAAAAITGLVASGIPAVQFTGGYASAVSVLTFATTIAVNALLGNIFRLALTNSTATMGVPANPVNGQAISFWLTQPTASATLAWATGTGGYDFGASWSSGTGPTLSAGGSKTDIVNFVYDSVKTAWLFTGATLGF
jgi:Pectate lyase superfamily protein